MSIRYKGLGLLVAATGFGAGLAPTSAVAAQTSSPGVICEGIRTDVAADIGGTPTSSFDALALAGKALQPPIDALPPFPTTVTSDAPAKVTLKSGDLNLTFNYDIRVPDLVAQLMRDKLGKSSIVGKNAEIGVQVTSGGAVLGDSKVTISDTTLDLNNPASSINVTIKIKATTDKSGRLIFRGTPFRLALQVDGSLAGAATIGTATVDCDVQGVLASTVVSVPGTPNTPAEIQATAVGGETATIPLLGRSDITPDDGNPILGDTLKLVGNAANGARIENGALIQPTALAGGTYTNDVEICAGPRVNADTPGVDEEQTITFPSEYQVPESLALLKLLNPHPLGMKLKFGGEETAEIPLTSNYKTAEFIGQFVAPSAGTIKAALVALPNIEAADIKVTRVSDLGYKITFTGKLGQSDQPNIELSDWRTQLDYAAYEELFKLVSGGGSSGGSGGSGGGSGGSGGGSGGPSITEILDMLGLKLGDILDALEVAFPQKPAIAVRDGEAGIAGGSTGPLCTSFQVRTTATPFKPVKATSDRVVPPCKISGRKAKVTVARTRVVAGRQKTVKRTVTVFRTVRTGQCGQALVIKGGKLTINKLPVRGSKPAPTPPKKVTITVTGSGKRASVKLSVSQTTGVASGSLTLPAALGKGRVTVKIGGAGVASQSRTLLPS